MDIKLTSKNGTERTTPAVYGEYAKAETIVCYLINLYEMVSQRDTRQTTVILKNGQ